MTATRKQFFNIHNHTIGSLLDGISKPETYAQRALELGQPAIAATDHGNLFSLIETYKAAKEAGIPFMPGAELYCARKTRFDTDPEEMSGRASSEWEQRGPYHLIALAYNNQGYKNLLKISSLSFTEGVLAGKGRVDKDLIAQYSEGIILSSACLSGEVQSFLQLGDYDGALAAAATWQDIIGRGNYFIEIMDHGIPEERDVQKDLISIAQYIDAPIIVSCDSHYTHQEDHVHHDAALCISTKARLSQENRFRFYNDQFYLKSYEEMVDIFPSEWVENTLLISDRLNLDIEFGKLHYPVFEPPEKITVSDYFRSQIVKGADRIFGDNWRTERRDVAERLNTEMTVIREMGYEDYFLMVADIISWCNDNNILTGPGRGSAASSMVSYCLGITQIDPLQFNLLFERFLTPGRIPDIDVDIDDRYRDDVLDYVKQKYGEDRTAQIITIGRLKAKSAINDVARVMEHPFDFSQEIIKAMPPDQYGVTKTIEECLETEEFRKVYDEDPEKKRVIDTALALEDMWRETGVHAGGLIVADAPIMEYCPVIRRNQDAPITTQWDMRTAEEVGLLKMDLLGNRNLGIIEDTIRRVKDKRDIDLGDPYDLARNPDPAVMKYISKGNTAQVFQMGSDGLTSLVMEMGGVQTMEDIMAAIALYRPGPMGSGFHKSYAKRKKGRQKEVPLHPLLQDITKDTRQILLYQEQIQTIGRDIAGFDPVQSNKFLKSIGKKDRDIMVATKESFVKGCVDHSGISVKEADDLFAAIEPHCDYSFNAAHAVSYAFISYITAHLKYYYPAEYSAACLSAVMFAAEEKFKPVLNDVVEKIGVNVTAPSVNYSSMDFDTRDNDVVFAISGIRSIGPAKSIPFVEHRNERGTKYTNIHQFFREANVSVLDKTFVEALIYSGGLDELVPDSSAQEAGLESTINMLVLENKTIGHTVTANLFDLYYDTLLLKDTNIRPIGSPVNIKGQKYCAVVKSAEFKISKAGKRFARIQLEDSDSIWMGMVTGRTVGAIESVQKARLEDIFVPGNFLQLKCAHRDDEEFPTVFIYDIDEIYSAQRIGEELNSITVLAAQENLPSIEDFVFNNPGSCKVFVEFPHPHAKLSIRKLLSTKISDSKKDDLSAYGTIK